MEKDVVLDKVLDALEIIAQVHKDSGRHELNRTDLEKSIAQLRATGLAAAKPAVQKLF